MQRLLTEIIDFIFPPSSEVELLKNVDSLTIRKFYNPRLFQNIQFLSDYKEPIIKAAILENKFHHNTDAAKILGSLLSIWIKNRHKKTLFVPIPLGPKRLRVRGYNQTTTILQSITPKPILLTNLLKRKIETEPQSSLNKCDRKSNLNGVFEVAGSLPIFDGLTEVIIVDDVVTTGATLNAARATLAPHLPPNVTLICLALSH